MAFTTVIGPVCRLLAIGAPGAVEIRARDIVRLAICFNATALLLAHNHPSQDSRPSRQDIESTCRLKRLLAEVDVDLLDHLIFVADSYRSMKTGRIAWL